MKLKKSEGDILSLKVKKRWVSMLRQNNGEILMVREEAEKSIPKLNQKRKDFQHFPIEIDKIGLEWEPQLSLPSYGSRQVFVFDSLYFPPDSIDDFMTSNTVAITPPRGCYSSYDFRVGIDIGVSNFEIRSYPVTLLDLSDEIQECERAWVYCMEKVREHIGVPVGSFLPKTLSKYKFLPSKHLNISLKNFSFSDSEALQKLFLYQYPTLYPVVKLSYSDGVHLHFNIPYTFSDYHIFHHVKTMQDFGDCLDYISTFQLPKEPYFLGYVRGEKYQSMNPLI